MVAVKGGELSYTTLAMEREQTAYRSVLPLTGALAADREPIPLHLVRGCIAMPFTAGVRAVASSHRLADASYTNVSPFFANQVFSS